MVHRSLILAALQVNVHLVAAQVLWVDANAQPSPTLPCPQMPDVLVRLERPAGWQPPPPPTFSGVEVASQGGSGQEASVALTDAGE